MRTGQTKEQEYDVFLSHPHTHAEWVESLAHRLEDEEDIVVWLDKWILIPGGSFQRPMARGLEEAPSCAVFVAKKTPRGDLERKLVEERLAKA